MCIDTLVRGCKRIELSECKRDRGRPRKSCNEVIRHDLRTLGIREDMAPDRGLWRAKIKVADFT